MKVLMHGITAKDNNLNYKTFYSLDELKQYLEI